MLILSIGLNESGAEAERPGALARTLDALRHFQPFAVGMTCGEWEGVPERTLHVAVPPIAGPEQIAALAAALRQTAIAVLAPGAEHWTLIDGQGGATVGGHVSDYPVVIPAAILNGAPCV
jgi:hypothetical protein